VSKDSRRRISKSKVRRLIKAEARPASSRVKDGRHQHVIKRRHLDGYHGPGGQRSKKQLSLERSLATLMSIQPPIRERRLRFNELRPFEQRSSLHDPDREFDHFFEKMFGWDAVGKERYKLYKEFLQYDGDLLYLIWLEHTLEHGDNLLEAIRQDVQAGAQATQSIQKFLAFVNSPFMDYVGHLIILKSALSIKLSFPDLDPSFPSNKWLEKTGGSVLREACVHAFARYLYDSKPEKQKRAQAGLKRFMFSMPQGEVFWEYVIEPEITRGGKGGNVPDYWGTFFLLVISKHLSENNKPPRYTLCYDLLNLFRAERSEKSSHQKKSESGTLAQTKIQQLTKFHPNWPHHLSLLRQTFLATLKQLT